MKKFCLLLVLFTFLTSVPSFGMKLIVNDDNNRRVPSRCSGPVEEYSADDNNQYEYNVNYNYQPVNNYNSAYWSDRYEFYYKPLLSRDMRTELVGTTWYYPKYVARYNPSTPATYSETTVVKKPDTVVKDQDQLNKRFIREAADYYTRDTLSENPEKLYPAGFDI